MQCTNTHYIEKQNIRVPCGVCTACRIRKTNEWTIRLTYELQSHNNIGSFVTLTYDDEHIHKNWQRPDLLPHTLSKTDAQNFVKKLRKRMMKYEKKKIRYYLCGEYGEETQRPHLHIILFGVDSSDIMHRNYIYESWDKCTWTPLRKQKSIGFVAKESIQYTVGYIQKSFMSYNKEDIFQYYQGRIPPFNLQSQGLGIDGAFKNAGKIYMSGKIPWQGTEVGIPKYWTKKVGIKHEVKRQNKIDALVSDIKKYNVNNYNYPDGNGISGRIRHQFVETEDTQRNKNILTKKSLVKRNKI